MGYKRKQIAMLLCTLVLLASGCARIQNRKAQIPVAAQQQQVEMRFGIARLLERNGKFEEARKAYMDILSEYPNHDESYHRIAVSLVRQERIAEALVYFEKAAAAATPGAELLGDWGYAQYLAGDTETAEVTLRQAIQKSPNDPRSINNLAIVLGEQNRLGEALELFRRVNNEAEAMANLAFVQTQLGAYADAKASYHRALGLKPSLEIAANGLLELHENSPDENGPMQQVSTQPATVTPPTQPTKTADEVEVVASVTSKTKTKTKNKSNTVSVESLPSKSGLQVVEIDAGPKAQEPQKPTQIELPTPVKEPKKVERVEPEKEVSDKARLADTEPNRTKPRTKPRTKFTITKPAKAGSKDPKSNNGPAEDPAKEKTAESQEPSELSVFADEFKIFN